MAVTAPADQAKRQAEDTLPHQLNMPWKIVMTKVRPATRVLGGRTFSRNVGGDMQSPCTCHYVCDQPGTA